MRRPPSSRRAAGSYQVQDHYFHQAKKENYLARSVFKLKEIQQKHRLFRPGMNILDLGAAPGSWSQLASELVGPRGFILGIDLKPIELKLPNARFICCDLLSALPIGELLAAEGIAARDDSPEILFDVVMSDMAPATTGIKSVDQARSMELCELALKISESTLKIDGSFICKFFQSSDFEELRRMMQKQFRKVDVMKPDSTRKISKEIFLIGQKKVPEKGARP